MLGDTMIQSKQLVVNPEYKQLENPWKSHHDQKTTQETIKQLLAGGTPEWVKHPEDYRNYAKEAIAEEREVSLQQVRGYQIDDQEELVDLKARNVNIISTREF